MFLRERGKYYLSLADKAHQYFNDLADLKHQISKEIYGRLSSKDLKNLKEILEKILAIATDSDQSNICKKTN